MLVKQWTIEHAYVLGLAANLILLTLWSLRTIERPSASEELERMKDGQTFRGRTPSTPQGLKNREKKIRENFSEYLGWHRERIWWFALSTVPFWLVSMVITAACLVAKKQGLSLKVDDIYRVLPTCETLLLQTVQSVTFNILTVFGVAPPDITGGLLLRLMMLVFGIITAFTIGKLATELFATLRLYTWIKMAPVKLNHLIKHPDEMLRLPPLIQITEATHLGSEPPPQLPEI